MSTSSHTQEQEASDCANSLKVTENICSTESEVVLENSPDNKESENVSTLSDSCEQNTETKSSEENIVEPVKSLHVGDDIESSDLELPSAESCGEIEAKEKSGREEEEATLHVDGTVDVTCASHVIDPLQGVPSSYDQINISVSEVVTAFQEVKSELKNAVKDAQCEFVTAVSEVKNELSQVLSGAGQSSFLSEEQQTVPSERSDANDNILSDVSCPENLDSNRDIAAEKETDLKSDNPDSEHFTLESDSEKELNDCHNLILGSSNNLELEDDINDNIAHSVHVSMDVNMYSDGNEVNANGPTENTMDTQIAEVNENTVEGCPLQIGGISQGSCTDDKLVQSDANCMGSNGSVEFDIINLGKDASEHTSSCIEEPCARGEATSAPSTPVPSGVGSVRRVIRPTACPGRRVSFPEDDTRLISSYLEPVNPWQQMAGVTVEEIAAAYRSSCERHSTQPLPGVLQQIKALPLVVGGRVECISLRGQRLEGGQCEGLEEIFRRVQFKILDLEGCSLEDDTAIPLFDMIEFYDSATQLNISCNSKIGFRGWQACARMLKRTPSVEYLDARNTNLNETNMPILGRALRLGARLHTLHLENCNLTGRPLIMLTAALKQNDTLAELYLAENRLGVNDCIQLGNLVRANSTLRVLDLRNNNVQDAGCGHICEGICEQQKLQNEKESNNVEGKKTIKGLSFLILWNNHLTQQSSPHLASLLSGSTSLEMINLGRNNLTSEGILRLKEALLRNRSLLRLGLQAARIADEGAVALAEYTADNTIIQQIDLRENPIRVAGLMALAHSLRLNTNVTQMDLDSDPRTEPAAELAERHLALQKEIKEYCQRNLTNSHIQAAENQNSLEVFAKVPDQDKLSVNPAFRKVSLTCETSHKAVQLETRNDTPVREEEKQKYVSPAPSPLPSPAPSPCQSPSPSPVPSPMKNRFRVFKVQEASKSASQLPLNSTPCSPVVCSSAPVSQCGRSMSAGDLNLPSKQQSSRPNRFSIGGRFTVTRVTEVSGPCSLPSSQSTIADTVLTHSTGAVSSPKIIISSPVRVERGFSIEETPSKNLSLGKSGDGLVTSPLKQSTISSDSLPEGHHKAPGSLSGHIVRLKSDSDSDDVFLDSTNSSNGSGWSEAGSQRGVLRSSVNDNNNSSAEKDNDSVSSSELTDSGFLDDSVCGMGRVGGSCSPSPSSPHLEGDRDSLLSSSVDSTSQEDAGLGSSISTSSNLQTSPVPPVPMLPCTAQPRAHSAVPEPLKRAPLAAMENGSFDSDSEDSEVTTQSSDSTHSDEVRITTEQLSPRPAWGTKPEHVEESLHSVEASNVPPETTGTG
ncbi:protein phosphatase 1 regulatory subunit 37-like [Palaemon carinicauda]|uniref:protein phosphatase 1 regulatory subunit 37-like n=1 Tax=Palaemon carinicauda TaxID=392227 RepID=UPI0035B5E426